MKSSRHNTVYIGLLDVNMIRMATFGNLPTAASLIPMFIQFHPIEFVNLNNLTEMQKQTSLVSYFTRS